MTNFQALILAVGITFAGVAMGYALAPAAVNGCIYFSSPATLTNGQTTALSCDSTGKLRVTTTF